MTKPKTEDRHAEPAMVVYPVRLEEDQLDAIRKIARTKDRTRQSVIREAIRIYLARAPK